MTVHPHGEEISAYMDGMLDVRKTRQMARHISSCVQCQSLQQSLRQTKILLRSLDGSAQTAPDFWLNTYRRLRLEGETDSALHERFIPWRGMGRQTQRRLAAGLAVAALLGTLVTPLLTHFPTTDGGTRLTAPTDTVDMSSLVRAHTESAARQPLADPDRQTMISADTDGDWGLTDVSAEAMGNGGGFEADAAR